MSGETWPLHGKLTAKERRRVRKAIRKRDGDLCHYCGEAMDFGPYRKGETKEGHASIEHLDMRALGGSNELHKLVLVHMRGNHARNTAWQRAGRPGREDLHDC